MSAICETYGRKPCKSFVDWTVHVQWFDAVSAKEAINTMRSMFPRRIWNPQYHNQANQILQTLLCKCHHRRSALCFMSRGFLAHATMPSYAVSLDDNRCGEWDRRRRGGTKAWKMCFTWLEGETGEAVVENGQSVLSEQIYFLYHFLAMSPTYWAFETRGFGHQEADFETLVAALTM